MLFRDIHHMVLNKHGEITSCLLYTIFSRQQPFSHLGECIFKQYWFFFHSSVLSSLLKKPVLELSLVFKLVYLCMDLFSLSVLFLNNHVFFEVLCWTVITKTQHFCGSAPCRTCIIFVFCHQTAGGICKKCWFVSKVT